MQLTIQPYKPNMVNHCATRNNNSGRASTPLKPQQADPDTVLKDFNYSSLLVKNHRPSFGEKPGKPFKNTSLIVIDQAKSGKQRALNKQLAAAVQEYTYDDVVLVGKADDAIKSVRRDRDGDNGLEALVDEVLHCPKLRGDVGAGGNDLKLLNVLLDARLLGKGLRRLDHLNAPSIADKTVDQSNPVWPRLFLPLEILRLVRPGLEAFCIGAWARNDFRTRPSSNRR